MEHIEDCSTFLVNQQVFN